MEKILLSPSKSKGIRTVPDNIQLLKMSVSYRLCLKMAVQGQRPCLLLPGIMAAENFINKCATKFHTISLTLNFFQITLKALQQFKGFFLGKSGHGEWPSYLPWITTYWIKLDFIFNTVSLGKVKGGRKIHISICGVYKCFLPMYSRGYIHSKPLEIQLMQRLIKHWWAGCLQKGLHMLVYSWHITHHPWTENFDCRTAVLQLHMNVATVGSLFIWGMCCWLIYNERNLKRSGWCPFPQSDKLLLRDKQLY